MTRNGTRIKPMTHKAFAPPPSSRSRNRSVKMWNSTIRYITNTKLQIRSPKKSQKPIKTAFPADKTIHRDIVCRRNRNRSRRVPSHAAPFCNWDEDHTAATSSPLTSARRSPATVPPPLGTLSRSVPPMWYWRFRWLRAAARLAHQHLPSGGRGLGDGNLRDDDHRGRTIGPSVRVAHPSRETRTAGSTESHWHGKRRAE